MRSRFLIASGALGLLCLGSYADDTKKTAPNKDSSGARETVAKPMSEKERKKKEERLRKELESPYQKWMTEDVAYIISDEERKAFKRLNTDDERENFIEQFWMRRDPTPDTEENEFKEEHYRRIAYANEHYASGIPGWKTDRGRIYIVYGPPDEIESIIPPAAPTTGRWKKAAETTSTYPVRGLAYRYIEGDRQQHNDRVRGHDDVGRVSHDDGPVGERRADCTFRAPA